MSEKKRRPGEFLLRDACPCGCFQPYGEKHQECPDDYVFQGRHPVSGVEGADIKGISLLPESPAGGAGRDPAHAEQQHFHGEAETCMV